MIWTISRITSPSAIVVKLRGEFDLRDFHQMIDAVADEMDDLTFRPVLFDDRDLSVGNVTVSDLSDIRNRFVASNRIFAGKKMALLMRSVADMEMASTLKKMMQPNTWAVLDVFREEDAAIEWLTQPF